MHIHRTALSKKVLVLAVALVATGANPPAQAQDTDTSSIVAPAVVRGELRLSLADAIASGIENNLGVQVARHDPLISYESSRIAWGSYDPEAEFTARYADDEAPVANALQAAGVNFNETAEGVSSLAGLVPWLNTEYSMSLTNRRSKTNSGIELLRPRNDVEVSFAITQPIMRDLIWNQAWTEVKTSGIRYRTSLEEFRRQLMDTVRNIELGYWELVATDEQERVARKSLEQAGALLEQTKVQYEVGVVSRVEVVEAEAGVAEREFDVITAENRHDRAQDELIERVLGTQLTAESRLEIDPIDRPEDYIRFEIDLDEAARKAFSKRPELVSQRQRIEEQQIQLKFAKNQRLPEVDLTGSIGSRGLSGVGRTDDDLVFGGATPTVGSRYRNAYDDLFQSDGAVQWSVGGVVSIPIGNIRARHRVTQADIELRRSRTELVRLQQEIILDIRTRARDLESAQQGIAAAERRRVAAEEQFRAESIRLEQGESTPFDVLLRERDLVEAESQEIAAFQTYRNSVAELERAQGTILDTRNVLVDQARRLR